MLAALAVRCGSAGGDGSVLKGDTTACVTDPPSGATGAGGDAGSSPRCASAEDCRDGDACTIDTCDRGSCVHAALSCDDQDVCTTDGCDAVAGCLHVPLMIDDNDLCTVDGCDPVQGLSRSPTNCDDGDLCTADSCDLLVGCIHTPIAGIGDGDACTADSCDPLTGAISHDQLPYCCPHSACATGVPLSLDCSYPGLHNDCVELICEYDPFCCDMGWDSTCVAHTRDPLVCPTGLVPGWFSCTCAHSYCTTGGPLSSSCDPCVKKVCDGDAYCCGKAWDGTCVAAVASVCDVPSGSDCQ
jgi:hypothetical protein